MIVNFYYSNELTNDDEGCLVQLCQNCAEENADMVQWAGQGDEESICELCEKANSEPSLENLSDRDLMRYYLKKGDFLSADVLRRSLAA